MRISDWSSDVCSSDLDIVDGAGPRLEFSPGALPGIAYLIDQVAACSGRYRQQQHRRRNGPAHFAAAEIAACARAIENDAQRGGIPGFARLLPDRKSTRLNSSH